MMGATRASLVAVVAALQAMVDVTVEALGEHADELPQVRAAREELARHARVWGWPPESGPALNRDESDFEDALERLRAQGAEPGNVVSSVADALVVAEELGEVHRDALEGGGSGRGRSAHMQGPYTPEPAGDGWIVRNPAGVQLRGASEDAARMVALLVNERLVQALDARRAGQAIDTRGHRLIDRIWDQLSATDELMRDIRAENLDGSEPLVGEVLERNTDLFCDVTRHIAGRRGTLSALLPPPGPRNPLTWSDADQERARAEGWDLFETASGRNEIQAAGDSPAPEAAEPDDLIARSIVMERARDGSHLHRKALLISLRPAA